jgi:hypothetical protein
MTIPSVIVLLIERLNQEFEQIEQDLFKGLALVRHNLSFFPNNIILTQYFAYLNAVTLAIETYRRQLQAINEILSPQDIPDEVLQEAGEDLGLLLGRVLETRIAVGQIINRLESIS